MKIKRDLAPEGYFSNDRPEMLAFVPRDVRHVLEIGCGEGGFAASIARSLGAEVWGVEKDPGAARTAARRMDRVVVGDFSKVLGKIPARRFDCAVFNDVLEHLAEPGEALKAVKAKLAPSGVVVCSLPNVLHVSVLKTLLWNKDWNYTPYGVLDRTHLRFFTKRSIRRMFDELGYDLLAIQGINANRLILTKILAFLSLGHFAESRFLQYACVARPRGGKGRPL